MPALPEQRYKAFEIARIAVTIRVIKGPIIHAIICIIAVYFSIPCNRHICRGINQFSPAIINGTLHGHNSF